ncbi:MAG: LPS export ABC transporter ATP-binding protein [Burkholderiales bacterium]|uniref:LPS export ABC transporter ATP-binding protein n=1 Tax=Limnobacter sp. TaxID=2003368 RepID=UPI00392BCD8F|nr:LPS export ABC transporter ATP-binding protein [Burkholderiales bacterium]
MSNNPAHTLTGQGRLQALSLRKAYRSKRVIEDVSLHVDTGEVVGLLGPNGAGKTTCFYMIVGLVSADEGNICLEGRDITLQPIHERARAGLSYLPQEASVFRKLTVEENIRAVLEINPPRDKPVDQAVEDLLNDLQIAHIRTSLAASLSGGERRRLEIARALGSQPRFVLLDEPFAGVDPIAVLEIQRIVAFLKSKGIGVLITDHNVRETLAICDRAYIISAGRVLASGSPDQIVKNDDVRRVYLGEHFRM